MAGTDDRPSGVTGKRFDDMIGLLKQGKSVEEVADWVDVKPEFVRQHAGVSARGKKKAAAPPAE